MAGWKLKGISEHYGSKIVKVVAENPRYTPTTDHHLADSIARKVSKKARLFARGNGIDNAVRLYSIKSF